MKTLTIYKRNVLERTGFRKYPYKQVTQVIINYDGKEFKNNHYEDVNNPRLKVYFRTVLETRSIKAVNDYIAKLGRTESDKFIKETINKIISEVK